tara:strand:+ start:1282 stop:3126 length:1845 start_codon:yes stop_codon:yes gene_type:complete
MKNNDDWMVEEVLKILAEATLTPDQAGTSTRGGPYASAGANGPYPVDSQKFKGKLPDEEEMKHDILSEAERELKVTWDTLPQPSVTELQWADPTSNERAELETFLNKVAPGKNLGEKLQKIQSVVENGFEKKTAMSTVLSYLVFLKTLTYIITAFNSASAGFTFESFLGVLLGGEQIATGQDTIADYKTGTGEYVSLKLLGVKGSEGTDSESTIDGSFTQLINDLSGTSIDSGGKMKYVIALKDLQGAGDKLGGTITVYEFTFSRENLADLMSLTPKSQAAFSLMDEASRDLWTDEDHKFEFEEFLDRFFVQPKKIDRDLLATVIGKTLTTSADAEKDLLLFKTMLDKVGLGWFSKQIQDDYDKTKGSNSSSRKGAINNIAKSIYDSKEFETAIAKYIYAKAYDTVAATSDFKAWSELPARDREDPKTQKPELNDGAWSRASTLDAVDTRIKAAVNSLWNAKTKGLQTPAKSIEKKKPQLKAMSFEASVAELGTIKNDKDYYDHIKKYSMGYGSKGEPQFQIRQPHVTGGKAGSGKPIGKLTVGRKSVEKALRQSVNDINEKMFEAFNKMRDLSTSLQAFFLKGLRSDDGDTAIRATRGIAKDTDDLMKQKSKN